MKLFKRLIEWFKSLFNEPFTSPKAPDMPGLNKTRFEDLDPSLIQWIQGQVVDPGGGVNLTDPELNDLTGLDGQEGDPELNDLTGLS